MIPKQDLWWNQITGPQTMVQHVNRALMDGRSVVLQVPYDLPWRHNMRNALESLFLNDSDLSAGIETIDLADENADQQEPGRFLLDRFAALAVRDGYREKSGLTLQEYLLRQNVLANRIIWIKGIRDEETAAWIQFCRQYKSKSVTAGLFVLEVHEIPPKHSFNTLEYVRFDAHVSRYDLQLFCSFLLSERNDLSIIWKQYLAALVAKLCDVDAELAAYLIGQTDLCSTPVTDILHQVMTASPYGVRGQAEPSGHIMGLFRTGDLDAIRHRVWAVQVQILFPYLEIRRVQIIQRWYSEIDRALQFQRSTPGEEPVWQFKREITDPMELEWGTLVYMMNAHHHSDSRYILYIPDEAERENIQTLHQCRNALAHANDCAPDIISQVIRILEQTD